MQSAGPGNINIPEEKIYELGNFRTVATVRDTPDLSFDMESFDMSCEVEAILTGQDPTSIVDGDEFDFDNSMPLDIISPFKAGTNEYNVVRGVAIPYLTLERAVYRFGLRQNSTQTFTLRGDTINYINGSPYYQEFTNSGAGTYNFAHTAQVYVESGNNNYALCVTAINRTTNIYKRLFLGDDYTNTSSGFTTLSALSDYDKLCVVYGSSTAATYLQTVHQGVSVKPAAIRGKDIDVYIGSTGATPSFTRWASVQSFEVTRSVNLENDEEFGNPHYVDSSYDTAEVTGSIGVKAANAAELFDKIQQIADVSGTNIVGPFTSALLPLEVRISDPDSGDVLKTLYIPDARFTIPSIQGRVQTKLEVPFPFTSDGGSLLVYAGQR